MNIDDHGPHDVLTRRHLIASAALAGVAGMSPRAFAEPTYPSKPIELAVPYTAGGTSDLVGRIVAKGLSERLKTPVVVMNRVGAAGTLAMKVVAAAPPDGYMLGIGGSTNLAIAPYLMSPQPYDPVRDFTALAMAARAPFILVTSPQADFKSLEDLVAYAKAHPGKLNYGSSGVGSSHHLMTELFDRIVGIKAEHIPFKGGAENVAQLMAGTVDFMFESSSSILPQITAGKLRALAVSGEERLPEIPNVRTVREAGIKDFVVESTIGVVAPANLPKAVQATLAVALQQTLDDPAIREAIAKTGSGVPPLGDSGFATKLRADANRWRTVISEIGIKGS